MSESDDKSSLAPLRLSAFLEEIPPGQVKEIEKFAEKLFSPATGSHYYRIIAPDLQLHCAESACGGLRFFRCDDKRIIHDVEKWDFLYLSYRCSNCTQSRKTFALAAKVHEDLSSSGYKFG